MMSLHEPILRYEITRSATDAHLRLVYPAGRFESLPFEVRLLAPWVGGEPLAIETLRPEHRLELAVNGYALVRMTLAAAA
jgi:hypothetical protein